nr:helix-turn-helix domain-containing protein [Occultella kanbiaonis]
MVDAATALLDEGGPAAVTMREVGRRAGVSHNAPYKHFADKESLLATVAARELDAYAALDSYLARALRNPARFRLVCGRWTVDGRARPGRGRGHRRAAGRGHGRAAQRGTTCGRSRRARRTAARDRPRRRRARTRRAPRQG